MADDKPEPDDRERERRRKISEALKGRERTIQHNAAIARGVKLANQIRIAKTMEDLHQDW